MNNDGILMVVVKQEKVGLRYGEIVVDSLVKVFRGSNSKFYASIDYPSVPPMPGTSLLPEDMRTADKGPYDTEEIAFAEALNFISTKVNSLI
jgi:hypothetical protein